VVKAVLLEFKTVSSVEIEPEAFEWAWCKLNPTTTMQHIAPALSDLSSTQ
jgi:hypothetical protein